MSSSSSTTTTQTRNRRQLYRLTNRILNSHSLHFIPISLLFLPLTFFAASTVQFSSSSSLTEYDPFNIFLIKSITASSRNLLTLKTLITLPAFFFSVILPTIAGLALITYTTNQIIHSKPPTFSSTIKSLSTSYIPLLHTLVSGSLTLIIIFLAFTLSQIAITKAITFLGSSISFSVAINLIFSYALAFTIIFLIVIWGSATTITVLESKSGFEALQQSANQSKEFRRHSFSIVFITGFGIVPAMLYPWVFQYFGPAVNWMFVLQVGAMCLQSSLMILLYVVANTVLYVQGKVTVEGELSGEYVKVAMNDKDGGEVVDEVVEVNGGFNYMMYLLTIVWVFSMCVQFYNLFKFINNV